MKREEIKEVANLDCVENMCWICEYMEDCPINGTWEKCPINAELEAEF